MSNRIINKLKYIEKKEKVKILYAVESGSRGWGFASKNSDYDVRFIYAHPLEWYLSIGIKRDVIEYPPSDEMDITGWDIKKALHLFKKSNPPLYEWLNSPIVYLERGTFTDQLRKLMPKFYSSVSSLYHYLHMAKGNYRDYLKGEKVRVKKYFYVLRPILACMWIERKKTVPAMEFEKLLQAQQLGQKLKSEIKNLLERKRRGEELGMEKKIRIINIFLEDKIKYLEKFLKKQYSIKSMQNDDLDGLFQNTLKEQ